MMRRLSCRGFWRALATACTVVVMASEGEAQSTIGAARAVADRGEVSVAVPHGGLFAKAIEDLEAVQKPAPGARRRDSVLNGVLIGAGIGALAGLIPDHLDDCEECHDALWGSIAVGAGIGLAVDLLRNSAHQVSPPRTHGPRFDVALGRKRVGLRGIIDWR